LGKEHEKQQIEESKNPIEYKESSPIADFEQQESSPTTDFEQQVTETMLGI
jgi:hypothetical protein